MFKASCTETGLYTKPQWKLPTNPCKLCVPHVVASPSRMLLCFLNLTVPHRCTCLKFPAAVILLFARHCGSNACIQASEEHRQSPWSQPCHRSAPRGLSCYGLLLAIWPLHLPILQNHFCFLDNFVEASRHIESGLVDFWICVGLPLTHLYPSRSLGRKIWNLAIPIHSSERLTPFASVKKTLMICSETLFLLVWFFCVITPKYFNEGCFVICVVKLQSKFFMVSRYNSPRIDHESSVVLPVLSPPSISTSCSCKNLPSTYRWRYCTIKKSSKTKMHT